jgi:integrase
VRRDAQSALARAELKPPSKLKLHEAADQWLAGARDGSVRTASGDPYKPSAVRSYQSALRLHLLPDLGHHKLSEVRRADVQDVADRMLARGLDPSTISNAIMPLRAIFRRAINRGIVTVNPTTGLELPAVRGKRDRIASPDEAAKLIAALPPEDRALHATALYGGLRRGELRGLRWQDVDLAAGLIHVRQSWDRVEGAIKPKSRAGERTVPIPAVLRDFLIEHKMSYGGEGFVFAGPGGAPFNPTTVARRAKKAWATAKLAPIGLHESRHTFASMAIAAGVGAKALSVYMGHSSITITLDKYGHLMPGNEDEAAGLLDAYLERTNTQARIAAISE